MEKFIKVVDQDLAEKLAGLGFQYIKEGSYFAFISTDELVKLLQGAYSSEEIVCESKLRF